jgi:Protein of unknown function DUF262
VVLWVMAMLTEELIVNEVAAAPFPEEQFEDDESADVETASVETIGGESLIASEHRLITHPYDFIIKSLKDQVDDKTLVLADHFQRRRVWDDIKSSRLIESLLINVPIPVCYFAEAEDGSYTVVDGQQRLTAIYRYISDDFPLRSLQIRTDLNGRKFSELGVVDSRTIRVRSLRCIVILKESDPTIKFDVFDRLNSNSVKLNRQELRNNLYRGKLNDLVKELCENKMFKSMRQVKEVDRRMKDCEMILRFFAFLHKSSEYQGSLAPFLDSYLQSGQNFSPPEIEHHRKLFIETISKVNCVFAEKSFRRHVTTGKLPLVNKAIYDVIMLYFAHLETTWVAENRQELLRAFEKVCSDSKFQGAIDFSTEKTTKIQQRMDLWYQCLKELNCPVDRLTIGQSQ